MGYPITGDTGLIAVDAGASATDIYHLFQTALRPAEFRCTSSTAMLDTTGFAASLNSATWTGGLPTASLEVVSYYPKAAPINAAGGLVTVGGSVLAGVYKYTLDINFASLDITSFTASPPTVMVYRPGVLCEWSGTYTQRHQSDAALPAVAASGGASATIALKLQEDGGTDPSFTGSILRSQLTKTTRLRNLVEGEYSYQGTGDLTSVASTNYAGVLPPAAGGGSAVVNMPDWALGGGAPADGIPSIPLVLTYSSGRTDTVVGFWHRLRLEVTMGELIKATTTVQLAGAITSA